MVDVSVRERGRAVTGLRAEDFVVTDNGVRQSIESVEATSVPIDLTVVVDVSGNPQRPWVAPPSASRTAQYVHAEVAGVAALLRPEDRLRALAIDTNVQQVLSRRGVASGLAISSVEGGGLSALYDTLIAALLQPVEPARRHVVVARTKGRDTISSVNAQAVRAVAERSDALLHIVMTETELDNENALSLFQCELMGFCWPTRSSWVPHLRRLIGPRPVHKLLPDGQMLEAGAGATGGGLHRTEVFTEPSLHGTFKTTLEDFRNSYVLRYTLQGVAQGGWHDIEVTVPRRKNYTVRARRGYLVDTPTPAPAVVPLPDRLHSVADFTAAYERGAYKQVGEDLRRVTDPVDLLRDFQEAGNPWPGNPRREATLLLEMVEPALFSTRREVNEAGIKAVERFRWLIRHPLEADPFERYWYFALLAMLEGAMRPTVAEIYADAALERFPDEPRFQLSRAIIADQRTVAGPGDRDGTRRPATSYVEPVRRYYTAAFAHPQTAVEARIRFAFFLHRLGAQDEALTHLTAATVQPIGEASLRYLHQLVLGHVLWSLKRGNEAVAAYRHAASIAPAAQSPKVALMNTLLLRGDRQAAETLAQEIQTDTSRELDPWWMYWQGDYRLHAAVMARLREMSQ
jgi:VWFA-related protein